MEGVVSAAFNDLDKNFWNILGEAHLTNLKELEDLVKYNLSDVFELDSRTIENQIESIREEFRREMEVVLRDKFQELPHYILKTFKAIFTKTETGFPITWKNLTPELIGDRYMQSKKDTEEIITAIKSFETKKSNMDLDREAITSDKALDNNIQRVNEDFKSEYEEALRKHRSSELGTVPKWLWIILVYFMYDDVLDMLRSPILFYPTMLIIGFVVLCITLGHGDVPRTMVSGAWSLIRLFLGDKLVKLFIRI